ncbi:ATP-binding protein [Bacteroides sp.]
MNDCFNELSLSNYWNGRLPETGFMRKSYTDHIFGYIGNKLIKVLVGQRGAGKSYLLRQIVLHLLDEGVSVRNILYINRSFTNSRFISGREGLEELLCIYRERLHPVGKIYIFIEEIQNIDGWEEFVYSHSQDYVNSSEWFISGSNRDMLRSANATLLERHYVNFEIFPFSYSEYIEKEREEMSGKSYADYMERGGLPHLPTLSTEEAKWNYVSSVKDTALFRDIIQRYRVKDAELFEDVLVYLVEHLAELVSVTNLVSHFNSQKRKTSYDTIANYIGYLEDTLLVHRVERCQIRSKEVVLGSCRYYINDWAFMHYLYPFLVREQETELKNHVYLDLKRAGYAVYVGVHRNKVIDFLARKGDRIIYIQCASSLDNETVASSLYTSLESIQDNYEKWVVSLDGVALPSRGGIRHIQAWKLAEML